MTNGVHIFLEMMKVTIEVLLMKANKHLEMRSDEMEITDLTMR